MKFSFFCIILLAGSSLALKPEISASLRKSFMKFTGLGRDRPKVGTVMEPEQPFLLERGHNVTSDQEICDLCEIAIKLFMPVIETKEVYPKMVEFAKYLCIREKWFTDRVCNGAVDMFQEEIYAILPVIDKSPHWACSKLLKLNCGNEDSPIDQWWNVTLPPEPKIEPSALIEEPRTQQSPADTLQILHISDLHMDPFYVVGSEGNCTEPLCCRADSPSYPDPSSHRAAGQFGDYNCDTAPGLITALFGSIVQQHKIDAVYVTGDYTASDVWNQTRARHQSTINTLIGMIKTAFGNTPVFMAVGNHEGIPVNAFPTPATSLPNTQNMSWLYDDVLVANWISKTGWLPSSTAKDISQTGSYSTLLKPGWRVISINDNYCNDENWWLLRNSTDPQGARAWLVNRLHDAETAGERVHLLMHIPSGTQDCLRIWSWNYYSIMYRFRKTIAAQITGHTHDCFFTVYYDSANFTTPTGINYVGSSVTTGANENPAYQLMTVDANTMEVLDYDIYYVDLLQSNSMGSLQVKKLYSAKSAFNMTDLSPASWHQLALRMQTDDGLFVRFYSWLNRLGPSKPCDAKCKRAILCELHTGRSYDPAMCDRFVPPV